LIVLFICDFLSIFLSLPIYLPTSPRYLPFPPKKINPSGEAAASTSPPVPALTEQLLGTQSSITNHVDKVRALEAVITEHDAIKREVRLLRELVKKTTSNDVRNDKQDEEFNAADDIARNTVWFQSIRRSRVT
jgi:hypothetical protein